MFFLELSDKLNLPMWYSTLEPDLRKDVLEKAVARILDRLGLLHANHTLNKQTAQIWPEWWKPMIKELAENQQLISWIYDSLRGMPIPHYEDWTVVLLRERKIAILPGVVQ